MSSSSQTPIQTPAQIFAQLMATGAIDRFRKSLEKLIQPLSQTRYQSISHATDSFLLELPSVEELISNPKKLLQDAKDATMASVREDVIRDVQQTAVSQAAVELRRALRQAFDIITSPPKEQPKPTQQPSQAAQTQALPTSIEPSEIEKASPPQTPKVDSSKLETTSQLPNQTSTPTCEKSAAPDRNAQQSTEGSQKTGCDNGTNASELPTSDNSPPKKNAAPPIQTIPTDLFQTAHNILELKAKEKEAGTALAKKENKKDQSAQVQDATEEHLSPKRTEPQHLPSNDQASSQSRQGLQEQPLETDDSPNLALGERKQEKEKAVVDEKAPLHCVEGISSETPQAPTAEDVDNAGDISEMREKAPDVANVANGPRIVAKQSDLISIARDVETPRTLRKRGKRRKSSEQPATDDVGTRKRRRKQTHEDRAVEVEVIATSDRKRSRKDIVPAQSKRRRKAHPNTNVEAKKASGGAIVKRTGRKRGKCSGPVLNPAVAALIDPRNPNRPRRYRVSKPSCIPEDFDAQVQVMQILESLLEKDYASSFAEPVDLGEEGQSSYLREITNPMDLGTIVKRLRESTPELGYFNTVTELLADVELVWWNCAQFNGCLDPIVEDMNLCKEELSSNLERLMNGFETAITGQAHSPIRERSDGMRNKTRVDRSNDQYAVSKTTGKEHEKKDSQVTGDLNDGRLQGKLGAIFRYIEDGNGKGRKEWSSCKITKYDSVSRSYTILWEDKTETTSATIGAGCKFNIHRFKTD